MADLAEGAGDALLCALATQGLGAAVGKLA